MSLPERFNRRVRQLIGANAVWLPGTALHLGSVLVRGEGRFRPFSKLANFGASFEREAHLDRNLNFSSTGTRETLFQANAELKNGSQLDLSAEASVKIEFSRKFEYTVKSPLLKGEHIPNLADVAAAVAGRADWKHDRFYIVYELYVATEFSFIGTEKSGSTVQFTGKGSAIQSFLAGGLSAGLTRTGTADVTLLGKGGPLAMGLVRIKRDGSTDFV
jgi:hypothetical protein